MKKTKVNQNHQGQNSEIYACGNCWGHQEYEGEIIEKQELRNSEIKDAFILNFVKKHLS